MKRTDQIKTINKQVNVFLLANFNLSIKKVFDKQGNKHPNLIANIIPLTTSEVLPLISYEYMYNFLLELFKINLKQFKFIVLTKTEKGQDTDNVQKIRSSYLSIQTMFPFSSENISYQYSFMNVMTFLTKLFEETPKKELQEFFKPNTIFLFENMSYEEVVSYFNTFKYKISGGNSTERHILNNSEIALSMVFSAMKRSIATNNNYAFRYNHHFDSSSKLERWIKLEANMIDTGQKAFAKLLLRLNSELSTTKNEFGLIKGNLDINTQINENIKNKIDRDKTIEKLSSLIDKDISLIDINYLLELIDKSITNLTAELSFFKNIKEFVMCLNPDDIEILEHIKSLMKDAKQQRLEKKHLNETLKTQKKQS